MLSSLHRSVPHQSVAADKKQLDCWPEFYVTADLTSFPFTLPLPLWSLTGKAQSSGCHPRFPLLLHPKLVTSPTAFSS